jgi:hypothetical protein
MMAFKRGAPKRHMKLSFNQLKSNKTYAAEERNNFAGALRGTYKFRKNNHLISCQK